MGCVSSTEQSNARPVDKKSSADKTNQKTGASALDRAKTGSQIVTALVPHRERGKLLQGIKVFSTLGENQREKLGGSMQEKSFKVGEKIFSEGAEADGMYFIVDGVVKISTSRKGAEVVICDLKQGDYFGETALSEHAPRMASATAKEPCKTLFLEKVIFEKVFGEDRIDVTFANRRRIAVNAGAEKEAPETQEATPKSPEIRKLLNDAISANPLFQEMAPQHKDELIDNMHQRKIAAKTEIIKQGDAGNEVYVIESGEFEAFKLQPDGSQKKVARMGHKIVFGELAIMYNAPRAATIIASKDSVVWVVHRATFRKIARLINDSAIKSYHEKLSKVDLLSKLASYELDSLAEAVEEVEYGKDDVIVKEGDDGDCMYFLIQGRCDAFIKDKDPSHRYGGVVKSMVATADNSPFFGELALNSAADGKRKATVVAMEDCRMLRLSRNDYNQLLGEVLSDELKKTENAYKNIEEAQKKSKQTVAWSDITIGPTLGKGSFGHVQLVTVKGSDEVYALKGVWKQQIVETQQQGHIMSEKEVMETLHHPFLVRLHATYRDKSKLFFLLDACLGGELFTILRKKTCFDSNTAKFYAACVVEAFAYMHSKDTIYRDLKPENLMLNDLGYIRVTDFGFAKKITGKTWTLCGTPDYLAYEIVASKGHGKGVDWWTLGILIFEMLASYPPFFDDDPMRTYAKILEGVIKWPSTFGRTDSDPQGLAAKNIVKAFVERKSTKRLGVGKQGVERIKEMDWFKDMDWDALVQQKIPAPFPPVIKSTTDTHNFEKYNEKEVAVPYTYMDQKWDESFGPWIGK